MCPTTPAADSRGCVSTEQGSNESLYLAWLAVECLPEMSKLEEGRMVMLKALAQEGFSQPLTVQVLKGYLKAKHFSFPFVVDGVCACGTEVSTHVEGGHLFNN